MQAMDDMGLVREYALRHSEPAFATLVARHIDLVYSAAWRHTGNHHQAEEITQAVFVILARKARSLGSRTILPGWLFQTARLTAANYVRTEIRRARREQEAYMQSKPDEHPDDLWQQVAPFLNDAIAGLGEKDRHAIVLRYLQGRNYREVAAALGGTEEAAQMRVSRALEKLRQRFAKRGVALSAAGLGGVMAAQGIQAAPAGLAAAVAASAVHATALTASTLALVKGTLNIMAWTKVKFAVGAGVAVLLACQQYQGSALTRQLANAREDLRGAREALAAQEQRIAEVEQQAAAIAEVGRDQEQALQQLRARRLAAANPGGSNPAATAATTLLSAMLQDPDGRAQLRTQLVQGYRTRYGPLARDLNLDPELAEKMIQTAGDRTLQMLVAVAAVTDGTMTAEAALQVEADAMQAATNQVRLELGEAGFAKFQDYTRTYPARSLLQQFDKQRGPFPINDDQRSRLYEIMLDEPSELTRLLAGEVTVELAVIPDALEQRLAEQAAANRRILQRAADVLTPEQLDSLALMQNFNLSNQRRTILRMLRKL